MAGKSLKEELESLSISESDYSNWGHLCMHTFPGYPNYLTGERMKFTVIKESNVAVTIRFSATYEHYEREKTFDLYLKADGTAKFSLIDEEKEFPELTNFVGNWMEAYVTLAKVLAKNFPKHEFSDKFVMFLEHVN